MPRQVQGERQGSHSTSRQLERTATEERAGAGVSGKRVNENQASSPAVSKTSPKLGRRTLCCYHSATGPPRPRSIQEHLRII